MTEKTGKTGAEDTGCPECGAPREPDHTPSCDCTERAAEALHETRTAEAAAAEDFDPLRIRPYVEMRNAPTGPPDAPEDVLPGTPVTRPDAATGLPDTPRAPHLTAETGALAAETGAPTPDGSAPRSRSPRRSRRTVLPAAGGAGIALVAAAGLALSSYHEPARAQAAPAIRQSIPDAVTPGAASAPAPAVAPRSPAPPPSRSPAAASASADPSPSQGSASPSPAPAPSGSASGSASPTPSGTVSGTPHTTLAAAPVLRRGDTGPQVTELQQRLRRLNLYGDQMNGVFTRPVEDGVRNYQLARGIEGDILGEYGPATRASLESETSQP
ncbi:peptidoglycan-binding protein [Streptomyces dangxiongensis]|uniref:Peptidoglycan-binding protein n=1 Tax=Streptomyces dangxiongensis TaxID=1442032 RepID=A0A3G2JH14_9ACTN|nr:peptidoglycan-binding domain-containing protein [Streptomyces dangxiongensis]AYN41574.1 peptidoglycan-binding protein [Streptomyces dangxiongensis]